MGGAGAVMVLQNVSNSPSQDISNWLAIALFLVCIVLMGLCIDMAIDMIKDTIKERKDKKNENNYTRIYKKNTFL